MNKFLSISIVAILLVSLSACTNKGDEITSSQKDNSSPSDLSETNYDAISVQQDSNSPDNLSTTDDVVNITEKMFVTYINEIYNNMEDYIGKSIKIEGMYAVEEYEENTASYVYRIGPGCCGSDGGMCGLEFTYDGDMPKDNDWIEVIGKLRTYDENGETFLVIDAQSVIVMDTRGKEVVYQ